MKFIVSITFLFLCLALPGAHAEELKLVPLADKVWAIVGPLGNRSPENLGNNATFGFIETDEGVVLIDSGGSYYGAQKIHQVIQSVTDKPIRYVINSGGQDHRWFGNDYFSQLGATIISSRAARLDQEKRLSEQLTRLITLIGEDKYENTHEKYADRLFDNKEVLNLGETQIEIIHQGAAHTAGDAFIWLADRSVMFTGDIVYVERMAGVNDHSSSKSWVQVFEAMAAYQPRVVVPGHGSPTTLDKAKKDTYQYLVDLRQKVSEFMEQGGDASDISEVDMSDYDYLLNYETLSGRNALKVYTELEWE